MWIVYFALVQWHFWFIVYLFKKRGEVADLGWALGFMGIALVGWVRSQSVYGDFAITEINLRSLLMVIAVSLWGLRLATYMFIRGRQSSGDPRYLEMTAGWKRHPKLQAYFKVFGLQSFLMALVATPIVVVMGATTGAFSVENEVSFASFGGSLWRFSGGSLGLLDVVGFSIFAIGLIIESVADYQKHQFRQSKQPGFIKTGLWSVVRFPNYAGEMLAWLGLGLVGGAFGVPMFIWSLSGPVLLCFLIARVSGIPLLEKRYQKLPGYVEYARLTPALLPRPFRSG
jgi:steroid 5-alpha reductase family enzyme